MQFFTCPRIGAVLATVGLVQALGQQQCLYFPSSPSSIDIDIGIDSQRPFSAHRDISSESFILASSSPSLNGAQHAPAILLDEKDDIAIHLAVANLVKDVKSVTGVQLEVYNDTLPPTSAGEEVVPVVVVGSVKSNLIQRIRGGHHKAYDAAFDGLEGKWESFDIRVVPRPFGQSISGGDANLDLENKKGSGMDISQALVITGSDRRGTVYAIYDLCEQLGISPFHWWSDIPAPTHHTVAFNTSLVCSHGPPSVKYRGLFINDEIPVLWNWARKTFGIPSPDPPFQTGIYEKVFEFVLRMKGNYFWPAMWSEMFSVDGMNVTSGLPRDPVPGPNQILANNMGIVMGTSHHEPMGRNKEEWDQEGEGEWDWENKEEMMKWWTYGAERGKDMETVWTVGMRGDGDKALEGASKELLEEITDAQRDILKKVYKTDDVAEIPQMWAMYKEVQGYFAEGLEIPDDVTALLADDNYGNLMAVKPVDMNTTGGAGVYYHADYVGRPRNYRWMNTNSYAKMWEQMNIAYSFNTTNIWILNVGSMKFLELPMEWYLSMAYDRERWGRSSLSDFMRLWAEREFGKEHAHEIADIQLRYSKLAERMKHELMSPTTYSNINYNEADNLVASWTALESRATRIFDTLPAKHHSSFIEAVWMPIALVGNLNKMHVAIGKNRVWSVQSRTAANLQAKEALHRLDRDYDLTQQFYALEGGKWEHMLDMPHIGYPEWNTPERNVLPPMSFLDPRVPSIMTREGTPRGDPVSIRFAVENSFGAWPGNNYLNCAEGYGCAGPVTFPMDPYGVQSRWVELASGGPQTLRFTATSNVSWLSVSPSHGIIKGDGSTDTRCHISVDWTKFPRSNYKSDSPDQDGVKHEPFGAITFATDRSPYTNMTYIVPVIDFPAPEPSFRGHVQGDGYVAIEAGHFSENVSVGEYAYHELEWYGRGKSGMEMFPVTAENFTLGQGPRLTYDFWLHGDQFNRYGFPSTTSESSTSTSTTDLTITLQIGPSLNFIMHKLIAFGVQFDSRGPEIITPVPTKGVSNAGDIGSVPFDWEPTVIQDVRNVTLTVSVAAEELRGKHSVTIWGMSAGIVLERIWVDLGGIKERGYSLLGPPESARV